MGNYWPKQNSSRPLFTTLLTSVPIKAAAETYQLRAVSITTAPALLTIADSSTVVPSSAAGVGNVWINGGLVGEYFAITPGQWYSGLPASLIQATEMS